MQDHTGCNYLYYHNRFLLHGGLQDPKSDGQNPKNVLYNLSLAAQPVVEHLLIDVQSSAGEEFHQPGLEWEGIITHKEVLNLGPVVDK